MKVTQYLLDLAKELVVGDLGRGRVESQPFAMD